MPGRWGKTAAWLTKCCFAAQQATTSASAPATRTSCSTWLADRAGLDGKGRLPDLGCGTGQLAIPLAARVALGRGRARVARARLKPHYRERVPVEAVLGRRRDERFEP